MLYGRHHCYELYVRRTNTVPCTRLYAASNGVERSEAV
jgi:hypothetical protein